MATLKDIAKEAGVSVMTVSNVINGNYSKVSKETIALVHKLVKKHNYVPNLSARSLSKKTSKLIAIIINTHSEQNFLKDPYISELFGELESLIRHAGYYTIIRCVQTNEHISNFIQNWNADGAIFLCQQTEDAIAQIASQTKCPVVFIDSHYKKASNIATVNINDFKGGYIATKHLIACGHRNIAFAGYYDNSNRIVSQRYEGYRKALEEAGITYQDEYLIRTLTRYEDGVTIGRDLANQTSNITAVFASADLLALGIIEGAALNGCIVPKDLSIIGFDNLELCSFVTPKLTTVSQDVKKKAKATSDLLFSMIENNKPDKNTITLDVELEIRQTVQKIH